MAEETLPDERRDFYVYVIFRPNGIPCYVGKGRGGRWLQHAKRSHNKRLSRIYSLASEPLPIIKIRDGLTNNEAIETEIALIAAIGRADAKSGPLVNLTDGGDGGAGHSMPQASRDAIAAYFRGKSRTPETIAKMSAAMRGRKPTPEAIEKTAAANRGKRRSQATRDAISAANRGKKRDITPAMAAVYDAQRGRPVPQFIISNRARKGIPKSPEHAEKLREHLARTQVSRAAKIGAKLRGRPKTAAEIAANPALQKGVPKSAAHRDALKRAHAGVPLSAAHAAAIGAAHRGKKRSLEARARMKAAQQRIAAERRSSKLLDDQEQRIKTCPPSPNR